MDLMGRTYDNTKRRDLTKPGTHLYYCDGKGCDRNCAEVGHAECHHTSNENHAKNKCRRKRSFVNKDGIYVEV